jgi:hypothetical protein
MDQSGNNQLLLRASQSGPPGYNGYNGQHAAADRMRDLLARGRQGRRGVRRRHHGAHRVA